MSTPLLDLQKQFSRTAGLFLAWMAESGYTWTMGDCWRSNDPLLCPQCGDQVTYQELLKYNGRTRVLVSKHSERRAMDLNLFVNGRLAQPEQYRPLGEKWEALGGKWGGRFGVEKGEYATRVGWDPGHFEL